MIGLTTNTPWETVPYHSLRFAMRDRLFYAPVENPTSIIDVGTRTGIWALHVADEYP